MELLSTGYAAAFEEFEKDAADIRNRLMPYADIIEISMLDNVVKKFKQATESFFQKNRKLNIGVMGQVKAGKSSFLNTLLFNGRDVLPRAATPKTATLTKIEYSEENSIEIEYYSPEEWQTFKEGAKAAAAAGLQKSGDVSTEILKLAKASGADPMEYINKGKETITFESQDMLMKQLNEYVGENGRLTPFVKCVILRINNDEIKDISVVDTPGLNDPIASRTARTKDFMKDCDVAFFLSGASQFLDVNDTNLLTTQLPSEGIKRLILICSRFDGGVQDTIDDHESLEEAIAETKTALNRQAQRNISDFMKSLEARRGKNESQEFIKLIEGCKKPCFISSMAYNMSFKKQSEYSDEEKVVFENLNAYDDLDEDTENILRKLGNIDEVKKLFDEVVAEKNTTLEERAKGFVPDARRNIAEVIRQYSDTVTARYNMLNEQDKTAIEKQKKAVLSQKNAINADIETIFGDIAVRIEEEKIKTTSIIRDMKSDCSSIDEHTETRHVSNYVRVSDAKWYNPFSWGKHHYEDRSYTVTEAYLDTADAIDSVNRFANSAQKNVDQIFGNAVNIRKVKTDILKSVIANFDTSDESFDPNFFRSAVESTLNQIEFPVIHFNSDSIRDKAFGSFQGRVSDTSKTSSLRIALSKSISDIFDITMDKLVSSVKEFKDNLSSLKDDVKEKLMKDIENEYDKILEQFSRKEEELKKYQAVSDVLNKLSV